MLGLFFEWYFLELPQKIQKVWGNYLWFFARYFALADLARGFFAPWKGVTFSRERRGFDMGDALSAALSNLISRIIGAVMRAFWLIAGSAMELLAFFGGAVAFLIWLALIPAIFYCFWKGAVLLF
jgi:hypothetical protein